ARVSYGAGASSPAPKGTRPPCPSTAASRKAAAAAITALAAARPRIARPLQAPGAVRPRGRSTVDIVAPLSDASAAAMRADSSPDWAAAGPFGGETGQKPRSRP